MLKQELVEQMRRAFLEITRVSYWRQINSGRLPRKGDVALALLKSVDVALDTIHTTGCQDWHFLMQRYRYLVYDLVDDDNDSQRA